MVGHIITFGYLLWDILSPFLVTLQNAVIDFAFVIFLLLASSAEDGPWKLL